MFRFESLIWVLGIVGTDNYLWAVNKELIVHKKDICSSLVLSAQLEHTGARATDLSQTISVPLYKVLPEQLPEKIRAQVFEAIKSSGPQDSFREVAFHVYYLKDGSIEIGPIYSSNSERSILYSDTFPALDSEISKIGADKIEHVESYHTHPMLDPMSIALSDMDVSASLRLHRYILKKGILGGYSENAIHTDNAFESRPGVCSRLEMTSKQNEDYRQQIAQAKIEKKQQARTEATQRLKILGSALPDLPHRGGLISMNGVLQVPTTERRQRIDQMIDATADMDLFEKVGFEKAIAERVRLISQIPAFKVVDNGDHVYRMGTSASFGLGRVLGYRGQIPNKLKGIVSNGHLDSFLKSCTRLSTPRPQSLAVYRNSAGQITATALYLRQEGGRNWVQSKILGNLPAVIEHNIEDVPLWAGDRVEFYAPPSQDAIKALRLDDDR